MNDELVSGAEFEDHETQRRFVFEELGEPRSDGAAMAKGWWSYFCEHRQDVVRNRGAVRLSLLTDGDRFRRV